MSNWSLFVKNPISDAEKSISGTLGNRNVANTLTVFGTVTGLPKPFTTNYTGTLVVGGKSAQQIADIGEFTLDGSQEAIPGGPTSGIGSLKYAHDILLSEMAGIIDNIYGTTIGARLVWEPSPEEPKQEDPQSTPEENSDDVGDAKVLQTSAIVDPKSINSKITLSVKSGPGVIIVLKRRLLMVK
jgi:hypothetical protein